MYCSASATLWTKSSCLIVVMSGPGGVPRGTKTASIPTGPQLFPCSSRLRHTGRDGRLCPLFFTFAHGGKPYYGEEDSSEGKRRVQRSPDRGALEGGGVFPAAEEIRRTGEHEGQGCPQAVRPEELPRLLQGIRGYADLVRAVSHGPRREQAALLEMVRGRQDQCELQLRGSPPRAVSQQGGARLRPRTRGRADARADVSGALCPRERDGGAAARLLRTQGGRPRDPSPADDARAAGNDARLCATGRHSLAGVRRILRSGVRHAHPGLGQPHPHLDGRLLARRKARRSQGERRHRGANRERDGAARGQGPYLAAISG